MTTRRNAGTGTKNAKDVATRNPEPKTEEKEKEVKLEKKEETKKETPKNAKDVADRLFEGKDGESNLKSLQGLAPKGMSTVIDEVMGQNEMEDKPVVMQTLDTEQTTRRDVIISQYKRMYKTDDVIRVIELLINEEKLGKYSFSDLYTEEDEDDFDEACQGLMYNYNKFTTAKPKDINIALVMKSHLIMPQSFVTVTGYLKNCGIDINKQLKEDVEISELVTEVLEELATAVEMSKLAASAGELSERIEESLDFDSVYKKELVKEHFTEKYIA